jgi:hypothetical protein
MLSNACDELNRIYGYHGAKGIMEGLLTFLLKEEDTEFGMRILKKTLEEFILNHESRKYLYDQNFDY